MYRQVLVAGVLAGSLLVGVGSAQEGVLTGDTAKGAAVLVEARKALGGDKLAEVKAIQMKGSFRRTAGNNQLEGDLEIILQLPDKMKRVEDRSAPGGGPAVISTQALNGTQVWDENTGGGAGFGGGFAGFGGGFGDRGGFRGGAPAGGGGRGAVGGGGRAGGGAPSDRQGGQGDPAANGGRVAIDPERLRQALLAQRQADLQRMLVGWLLMTDAPVTWVATAEAPDGKADVLEIKPAGGTPMRLFLDASTHMPLMVTWQGGAPQGGGRGGRRGQPGGAPPGAPAAGPAPGAEQVPPQVATLQMTFADYKAVSGVKFPQTVTRGINGQTNEEWSLSNYKVNPSLKADAFSQK